MKIEVNERGNDRLRVMEAKVSGEIILSEVFNGVGIRTEDDKLFGIAQRDTGLEVVCPDGALVGVKLLEDGSTFVEVNGKRVV